MDQPELWGIVRERLANAFSQGISANEIAEFTGVQTATVLTWLPKNRELRGETLIKLWVFLQTRGYDSPELDRLPELQRYIVLLYAHGIIDITTVCELFSVRREQSAHRLLRGDKPLYGVAHSLEELKELYDDTLQESLLPVTTAEAVIEESLAPTAKDDVKPVSATLSMSEAMLASSLLAALPLVKDFHDRSNITDRVRFRELIGDENLFQLTNLLYSLNSERARNESRP